MASKNLEQGILSVQQQDMEQGKRLLKIALKNDSLNQQERVQALIWLAETDSNPQFKLELYQQAVKIDPSNQDVINRLTYWNQQVQQRDGLGSQRLQSPAPQQPWGQQNQSFDFQGQQLGQGLTPSQGMPPANPTPPQPWGQQNQPFDFQSQQLGQGLTPSQGMPPANPQQTNWGQQNQPFDFQGQQLGQGLTPSQGMPPASQQGFNNQGFTSTNMQPVQNTSFQAQHNSLPQQPAIQLREVQRTVGITGGPNGRGTGFFATRQGLIVTTRHVVGGERQVTVQLLDRRQIIGEVVRSFPGFDLALIQTNVQLVHLLGVTQSPNIPDDMPIVAVTHAGEGIRSAKRRSINEIEQHWFPTIINHLKDAGGNPIFDAQNMLVGILTNNASRSNGYMYGLHIHRVYQCIDQYIHEKGQIEGQHTVYCNACGIISRAPSFGGYFCESCGNTHPYAINEKRYPQLNLAHLYGEDIQRPCPNCASQVGFYGRECLRCGYQL